MLEKRFITFLWVVCFPLAYHASAIELGDTRAQIEALHDTAPLGDRPKGIAIYRWDLWKLEIQYDHDVVWSLTYTKLDPMSDSEIESILDQNGGLANWHSSNVVRNRVWEWTRTDGATAKLTDDNHDRVITLEGGRMLENGTHPNPASLALVCVPFRPGVVPPAPQPAATAATVPAATPASQTIAAALVAPAPAASSAMANASMAAPTEKKEAAAPMVSADLLAWLSRSINPARMVTMAFAAFGVVMIVLGVVVRSREQ